jgi:hypothetical protein
MEASAITTESDPREPTTGQLHRPATEADSSFATGKFMERLREAAAGLSEGTEIAIAPPRRELVESPPPPRQQPERQQHQRRRPSSLRTGPPSGDQPLASAPATGPLDQARSPTPPFAPPLDIAPRRPGSRLRAAISRLFGGRRSPGLPRPAPPAPLDAVAAAEIAHEMSAHGASEAWTAQLIGAAGAHANPFATSLQAAAAAEIARRIVAAPALPATGAAVAFIGSGGAGKTRCTAALASAYRRRSTLGVTVIALDNPAGARELHRLLGAEQVPVLSVSGEQAASAVAAARRDGFVIVDTATSTPTDPSSLDALAAALNPLGLDATYVTLPATLDAQAARRTLAGFGRLHPTAVTITHADAGDQLAVAVEIAVLHRIPLAHIHSGGDHRLALAAVDPPALARQLLCGATGG